MNFEIPVFKVAIKINNPPVIGQIYKISVFDP